MTNVNTLIEGAKDLNIDLNENEIGNFILYKELLKEWNQKINITAITDDVEVDIKHFIDSIVLFNTGLFNGNKKIIDIGTGGGFPGIPLKIINKDLEVVLLDSLKKRLKFLDIVIEDLKLQDISTIHGRAEELSRNEGHREEYDIAVSRAVASLDTLVEYSLPFVKIGGHFIAMKGSEIAEELNGAANGIEVLGGKVIKKEKITLPLSDIEHSLIIIEKIKETPTKYPRGGGKPKSKPL